MTNTIKKLLLVSSLLVLLSAGSFYYGFRVEATEKMPELNEIASQLAAAPGDGWKVFGGFLMLVSISLAAGSLMTLERHPKE